LARAYAKNSLNPAEGNEKRMKDFWSAILTDFDTLVASLAPPDFIPSPRTYNSLMQRWQKQMQPDVNKFLAIKRGNPLPSGTDKETWIEDLKTFFKEQHKKEFRFKDCLIHLAELPKFAPSRELQNPVDMVQESTLGTQTTVPDMERCEGTKKAKKRIQNENSFAEYRQESKKRFDKFEQSIQSLISSIKKRNKGGRRQHRLDRLKDQRSFKIESGDQVAANLLNQKIMDIVDDMDESSSAGSDAEEVNLPEKVGEEEQEGSEDDSLEDS